MDRPMTAEHRELRRKRLKNLHAYWLRQGKTAVAHALHKQLVQLPIGGIAPDVPEPLMAHCGQWWRLHGVPFICPACEMVVLEEVAV